MEGEDYELREKKALEKVLEFFPEAQIDDIHKPFYTEVCDNGTAWIHIPPSAYPWPFKNACEPLESEG